MGKWKWCFLQPNRYSMVFTFDLEKLPSFESTRKWEKLKEGFLQLNRYSMVFTFNVEKIQLFSSIQPCHWQLLLSRLVSGTKRFDCFLSFSTKLLSEAICLPFIRFISSWPHNLMQLTKYWSWGKLLHFLNWKYKEMGKKCSCKRLPISNLAIL